MPLYSLTQIAEDPIEDNYRTVKNEDAPGPGDRRRLRGALPLAGLGAPFEEGGPEWTTAVRWEGVHEESMEGTQVIAERLGPDHKLGSPASSNRCPNATAFKGLENLSLIKNKYDRSHLLHAELGGPGNDSRNLVALPHSVNDDMSRKVEGTLKHIVNEKKGWVRYTATVEHAKIEIGGKDYHYASKISCLWHQLKAGRDGQPVEIAGTKGEWATPIQPPLVSNTPEERAALEGHVCNTDDAKMFSQDCATAHVRDDEVVLTNWNDVTIQAGIHRGRARGRGRGSQRAPGDAGERQKRAVEPEGSTTAPRQMPEPQRGGEDTAQRKRKREADKVTPELDVTGRAHATEEGSALDPGAGAHVAEEGSGLDPGIEARAMTAGIAALLGEADGEKEGSSTAFEQLRALDRDFGAMVMMVADGTITSSALELFVIGMVSTQPERYGLALCLLYQDRRFAAGYCQGPSAALDGGSPLGAAPAWNAAGGDGAGQVGDPSSSGDLQSMEDSEILE